MKLIRRAQRETLARAPPRYMYSLQNMQLAALPLRADIVAVYNPRGLAPGVYPCSRGANQALRLEELYTAALPGKPVRVLDVAELDSLELDGDQVEVVEVKTTRITEQAIGQLLTYEALLRIDTPAPIAKTLAAPRNTIDNMNPVLRVIMEELGIRLLPL